MTRETVRYGARGAGSLTRVDGGTWYSILSVNRKQHEFSTGTDDIKKARAFHRKKVDEALHLDAAHGGAAMKTIVLATVCAAMVTGCAKPSLFIPTRGQTEAQRQADYDACRAASGPRPSTGWVVLDIVGGVACVFDPSACGDSPDADRAMAAENSIWSCMEAKGYDKAR
jgi:hypothetical protein